MCSLQVVNTSQSLKGCLYAPTSGSQQQNMHTHLTLTHTHAHSCRHTNAHSHRLTGIHRHTCTLTQCRGELRSDPHCERKRAGERSAGLEHRELLHPVFLLLLSLSNSPLSVPLPPPNSPSLLSVSNPSPLSLTPYLSLYLSSLFLTLFSLS